jgi:TetR/AcrR family transcriptional regulator
MARKRKKKAGAEPEKLTRIQEANRKLILAAALEVFSVYGFRGTTIDQIAAKAGMSKPNLLYYFRRKQDIYVQVLEDQLETWLEPFNAIDPEGDPIEELRRYITHKIDMSFDKAEGSRLFLNEILHGAPAIGKFLETTLKRLVAEKARVIAKWIDEGKIAPVDPHHLIFAIWAMTQHYADFDVQIKAILGGPAGKGGFREQSAKAVLTIILNGIRPR